MIYGSVCSGIEAATVAWEPLRWRPSFFSEIDRFPSSVLKHHYPGVPNAGDFTNIKDGDYEAIDLLVGGTPCQDFSIAGLRAGLGGKRGALTIEYVRLVGRLSPRWFVWENVIGVLSIDGGAAFGTFLGELGKLGYGFAYRVLDAIHFGCACPRPRVFVVGYRGDWRRAAAVLFERESFARHSQKKAPAAPVLTARGAVAQDDRTPCILDGGRPRIATPIEHERALGFPDNYTKIGVNTRNGPRYRALGNSMAVPVMSWIGERIQMVEQISSKGEVAA